MLEEGAWLWGFLSVLDYRGLCFYSVALIRGVAGATAIWEPVLAPAGE
jgi:hypothetical protein